MYDRHIASLYLKDVATHLYCPVTWEVREVWPSRMVYAALCQAIELEKLMNVTPSWCTARVLPTLSYHRNALIHCASQIPSILESCMRTPGSSRHTPPICNRTPSGPRRWRCRCCNYRATALPFTSSHPFSHYDLPFLHHLSHQFTLFVRWPRSRKTNTCYPKVGRDIRVSRASQNRILRCMPP